jgi:5-methylcytosine-specific restriction endonuclease McrA
MSQVFVLNADKRPLAPIHSGHARRLLTQQKAAVFRRFPFTLILKQAASETQPDPLRLKIDPGSKTTGLALVNEASGAVVWAAELTHHGEQIKQRLRKRRTARRSRRQRKTRYRAPRFSNRRRHTGWLPPSLESRIANVVTWVDRLRQLSPIAAISLELVKFDTALMQNPEISGIEYQQGTLVGYETREYLLEKWQRRCAYCNATGVKLQIEHITPKARGGSNRVSNLTLACEPCNTAKGTKTAAEFGHAEVQAQARLPLQDVAAVNATRWVLYGRLQAIGLPVEVGTGGRTKWNRTQREMPKTHWVDAACVGASTPSVLQVAGVIPLRITATGRQRRQMCLVDDSGFPRSKAKASRWVRGFQTGDIVRARVPTGERAGQYTGRVAIKANGFFTIKTTRRAVPDVAHRYCQILQRADGYQYENGGRDSFALP